MSMPALVRRDRLAHDDEGRRIEPQRFAEHGAGERKLRQRLGRMFR
jgi:hypothetical protein